MGDSLENPDASVDAQSVPVVEFNAFADYLCELTSILVEDDGGSASAFKNALEDKSHQECIRKFLADPQVPTLFIQRSGTKGE